MLLVRSLTQHCAFHYGPATWFITLSPGEWLWEDLGTYLRELNPGMNDLTISALVVADPVSMSRFIDNKFKAVCACVCIRVCACVRACVCLSVCLSACLCVCLCVCLNTTGCYIKS